MLDYNTMRSNKMLRSCAREQLHGVWKEMAFITFVYLMILLPFNASGILNAMAEDSPAASFWQRYSAIVLIILGGPFSFGFAGLYLSRIRGEAFSLKNLFDGFQQFGKTLVLGLVTTILVFLWSLLLIIPGIIKGLSYSMAFYILHDNPDMKPLQVLEKSEQMMNGYKGNYLALRLSFAGWLLGIVAVACGIMFLPLAWGSLAGGILTVGVGFCWLLPYMDMTLALFYENLKMNNRQKSDVAIE
jgi:uncharacterized membrane protein